MNFITHTQYIKKKHESTHGVIICVIIYIWSEAACGFVHIRY